MRDPQSESAGPDFRQLFESAPGLYLVLLPDSPVFTIVAVSEAYLQATLTTRSQILGRGLFQVFPDNPDDPEASGTRNLRASLDRVVSQRVSDAMAVQKYDIPRPESEGGGFEERFWSPLNSPVSGADGVLEYIIHRVEDVTEFIRLKQRGAEQAKRTQELQTRAERVEAEVFQRAQELQAANENLRVANEQLGRLDQMKTAFFSNVSHEFRTPLTLLLGPLEALLSEPSLGPGSQELLQQMQRNALRLLRLVNSLLDFARMEAGRHSARFMVTDLAGYTTDLASAFRSALEKAGLSFSVQCEPIPAPMYVDRDMWEKVVMNLLSNALKFTFEGEIRVGLAPVAGGAELTVSDTGTGIAPAELSKVFHRFHRVEGARARSHEGTGIGLALVQELVQLHGGDIGVTSTEGAGTRFTVTLPAGRDHLPADHVIETGDAPVVSQDVAAYLDEALHWVPYDAAPLVVTDPTPMAARVLIADDNPDLRTFLTRLLAPHYEVDSVADGREALSVIQARRPDLVLSDVMMPHLDGLGLVRALRADPATRTLPVILLSARAGQEAALEGLGSGADDYLAKPFTTQELLARVRTHLTMARARDELNASLARANQELKAFSYSVSHDLQAPLRAIDGFSQALLEDCADELTSQGREYLGRIREGVRRMRDLITDMLELSRVTGAELHRAPVDISELARTIGAELQGRDPDRRVTLVIEEGLTARADGRLVRVLLENLLGNAWKFTARTGEPRIEIVAERRDGTLVFVVRDNGAGFEMAEAGRLFLPFQRLHRESDFPGTGIGLATVRRVVERHGGQAWAEGATGRGASVFFTLPPGTLPPGPRENVLH